MATAEYRFRIREDPTFKGAYGTYYTGVIYVNRLMPDPYTICPEVVMTLPIVIYTKKDFFLLEAINEKLAILNAAGLIRFWHFNDNGFSTQKESKQPKFMTLEHLKGSFYILLLGVSTSSFVFVAEVLISYVSKLKSVFVENVISVL